MAIFKVQLGLCPAKILAQLELMLQVLPRHARSVPLAAFLSQLHLRARTAQLAMRQTKQAVVAVLRAREEPSPGIPVVQRANCVRLERTRTPRPREPATNVIPPKVNIAQRGAAPVIYAKLAISCTQSTSQRNIQCTRQATKTKKNACYARKGVFGALRVHPSA